MTIQSAAMFKLAENRCNALVKQYDEDAKKLMVYMLSRLSEAYKTHLRMEPDYETFKVSMNTFYLWRPVDATHVTGSTETKLRQSFVFLTATQSLHSLDGFIGNLRDQLTLVCAAYEPTAHSGFIAVDDLTKAVFINGVDPAYSDNTLSKLLDTSSLTSA